MIFHPLEGRRGCEFISEVEKIVRKRGVTDNYKSEGPPKIEVKTASGMINIVSFNKNWYFERIINLVNKLPSDLNNCTTLEEIERFIHSVDMTSLDEIPDFILWSRLEEIRREINDLENQKMDVAEEVADYVKKKLELKDRKDALDSKEKYLRKRFEEAWIQF